MQALIETRVYCPYCGERISILVDQSAGAHETIEDCQVCCRPITLHLAYADDGEVEVTARHENE
ncbi:MAG: CPXCG motif-containing cysteine-rich protein [Pseudomonadales bacterium]|nr:CPXCG motif-containing cysteine-rich protein [Gammaproteobacteria bacterium]NNC54830.1 CPXCG motif-containing cysteine-rich protein [Pseudomonadales bacterium]NNL57339.1 CPXCG motif-containing cysteine-rich protein [Pseudomonadales bacterium]